MTTETNRTGFVHVDPAEKDEGIPKLGEGKPCARPDCPGPQGWESGFGLAGGGYGSYNFCGTCERVVEKTISPDGE